MSLTVPILIKINFSMYHTYILKSLKTKKFYIGYSENLEERIKLHNQGAVKATKNKGPWKMVYSEKFYNSREAVHREKQIKSWKNRNSVEKLILK